VALDAAITTGEGFAIRERNEGKDLAAQLVIAPLRGLAGAERALVVSGFARDGSRGLAFARNRRVGARVAGEWESLGYGVEVLKAWGVDADAERTPVGTSTWVRGSPVGPLYGAARLDLWSEDLGEEGAGGSTWLASAGLRLRGPDPADPSRLLLLAGIARTELGDGIGAVPGAEAFGDGTTLFLQIDAVAFFETPGAPPGSDVE
jgi:hypothetical protein